MVDARAQPQTQLSRKDKRFNLGSFVQRERFGRAVQIALSNLPFSNSYTTPDLEPLLHEVYQRFDVKGEVPQSYLRLLHGCALYAQDLMITGISKEEALAEAFTAFAHEFTYEASYANNA